MILLLLACKGETGGPAGDDSEAPPLECAEGEIEDEGRCVPEACGVGPWGGLEGDVYVLAGSEGGDGSPEAPFGTIGEALDAREDLGGAIVVGEGTYPESLSWMERKVGGELALLGRCPELVRVEGQGKKAYVVEFFALDRRPPTLEIQGFTFSGEGQGVVSAHGTMRLQNVVISEVSGRGLWSSGPGVQTEAVDLRVERIEELAKDGFGIYVSDSGSLRCERCEVVEATYGGILTSTSTDTVELLDVRVENTLARKDGQGGVGIWLGGGDVTGEGLEVAGSLGLGVQVDNATVDLRDVQISEVTKGDQAFTYGISFGTTTGSLSGLQVSAPDVGLYVGAGADIELSDSDIGPITAPEDGGKGGSGIIVTGGGHLEASGVSVHDTVWTAVQVVGASMELRDSTVERAAEGAEKAIGCVLLYDEGALTLEGVVVSECGKVGIIAEYDSSLTAEDLRVVDVRANAEGLYGRGVYLLDSSATVVGLEVEDTLEAAVYLYNSAMSCEGCTLSGVGLSTGQQTAIGVVVDGSQFSATDLEILDTEGPGLAVGNTDASATIEGGRIEGAQFAGALAAFGGQLTLRDVEIVDTGMQAVHGGGMGVFVRDASLEASGVSATGNLVAGLYVTGAGATVSWSGGTIDGGPGDGGVGGQAVVVTDGVLAGDGSSGLLLSGVTIDGQGKTGAVLDASSATFSEVDFVDAPTSVKQQACEGVEAPRGLEGRSDTAICEGYAELLVPADWDNFLGEIEVEE